MADATLDRIHIRELTFRCIIGTNPDEREKPQDVVVDIMLEADLRRACQSDCLDDTVNYKAIKQQIVAMAEASHFFLVERMAAEIASICLGHGPVQRVTVSVQKPGALRFARTVGVEIVRERQTPPVEPSSAEKRPQG